VSTIGVRSQRRTSTRKGVLGGMTSDSPRYDHADYLRQAGEFFLRARALPDAPTDITLDECVSFFSSAVALVSGKESFDAESTPALDEVRQFFSDAEALMPAVLDSSNLMSQADLFFERAREIATQDLQPKIRALEDYVKGMAGEVKDINVLAILGIARKEVPHSRFLAWLLDPRESHGLKGEFFAPFMQEAQRICGRDFVFEETDLKVELEKGDEHGVPDITISGTHPEPFLAVIENKIMAAEGQDQTPKYATAAEKKNVPVPRRLLIFLSPDGRPPKSPEFRPMSYGTVLRILTDLQQYQMRTETRFLVEQFIFNLRFKILHCFDDYLDAKRLLESKHDTDAIIPKHAEVERLYKAIQGGSHAEL